MTKDTEKALIIIYAEYLRRCKAGESKTSASQFTKQQIKEWDAFSSWHPDDIDRGLFELKKTGFMRFDICGGAELTPEGADYLKNQSLDFFQKFVNTVKDLIPLVSSFLASG